MPSRILAAKVLPPSLPATYVARPALERRLDHALTRRLTVFTAGAGFGKSTLLVAWAGRRRCAWYTLDRHDGALETLVAGLMGALRLRLPGLPAELSSVAGGLLGPDADEPGRAAMLAGMLAEALAEQSTEDLVLVVDDLQEFEPGGAAARLIEYLCRRAPPQLHLVLSSRQTVPFAVGRLRGQGQVLEVDGSMLAFSVEETAALLAGVAGGTAAELARPVHELTGGWPAAVRLAAEALALTPERHPVALRRLRRPGGSLFAYLAEEVFATETTEVCELVRRVAPLERFSAALCEALGIARAAELLPDLARRGVLVEPRSSVDGWFVLTALIRDYALDALPLGGEELRRTQRQAAAWLLANGHLEQALGSLVALGDLDGVRRLLLERGAALLAAGGVAAVVAAAERLPVDADDGRLDQLVGQAHQVRGDWDRALACFRRAAGTAAELTPGLAWRLGLIHHYRGDLAAALDVYERGRVDGADPANEAMLLASKATVYWLRGEVARCQEAAQRAFDRAVAADDPAALAAAHTVLAMLAALQGDRRANDAHYLKALDAAERAGDRLQLVRIRANRGSQYLEEGAYRDALGELEIAIRLAELTGFAYMLALALTNRAEVCFRLGELDQAIADFQAARAAFQRIGSSMAAYPLRGLGDVHRERGQLALARAAYEEAVALANRSGDMQGLVPALAGLARVLLDEDPARAARLADRAVATGPGMGYVGALVAAGWAAVAGGRPAAGRDLADRAATEARARRDRGGLAEALELDAAATAEPARAAERLAQAALIWRELGNPLGVARADLARAALAPEAPGDDLAEQASRRLRALGVRLPTAWAGSPSVVVRSLGGFRLLRDGHPVGPGAWQSKKARDLLKLLVARQGRPAPREALMDALWPNEDPWRLGNRLSVALSIVRGVLDPERRFPAEHFVTADKQAVGLALEHLEVDVTVFLARAAAGLRSQRTGDGPRALRLLGAAEALYGGDFLEEEPYEDWAGPLREQARAAYLDVVRALADLSAGAGDHDMAVRYLLRLLERDP
jgi:ATP/maltotriose-dependent transcriptional regulator MalT/DNA-binding SARP family transcriptional activator